MDDWYLVERGKNFVGDCTKKGRFFPVVGERLCKFLASVGFFIIPCPSRENLAIWFQFGPKLQNLMYHSSL